MCFDPPLRAHTLHQGSSAVCPPRQRALLLTTMPGSSVKFPQIGKIETFGLPRQSAANWLVKQSWATLTVTTFTSLFFLSVVFGALLYADNRYSANDDGSPGDPMSFLDCIHLSIQTFSTIGFGSLGPTTAWANWVITIESFVALVCCALVPGVFFLKFSRPKAKVQWTNKILVGGAGPHHEDGTPAPNADRATQVVRAAPRRRFRAASRCHGRGRTRAAASHADIAVR